MLWVNMDTFCVELSGRRRTRRPSLGGEVTVKTTDWFLLMPLKSLVTACRCHLETGVMEPLKVEEEQRYKKTVAIEITVKYLTNRVSSYQGRPLMDGWSAG